MSTIEERAIRAAYMRSYLASRRKKGICTGCGTNKAILGKRKCQECFDKWNLARMKRRKERKANGICTECDLPARPGRVRCQPHYEENKASCDKLRAARLEQGLCRRCGKKPALPKIEICGKCCLRFIAFNLWRDKGRWKDLARLLYLQGGKCVYSGLPLRVGDNASVDHRIPRAKGGSNDLDNLQWVDALVNKMKWDSTEEEFLGMVKRIASYHRAFNASNVS